MACPAYSLAVYAPPDTRIVTPTEISRASEDLGEAWSEKRHVPSSHGKDMN